MTEGTTDSTFQNLSPYDRWYVISSRYATVLFLSLLLLAIVQYITEGGLIIPGTYLIVGVLVFGVHLVLRHQSKHTVSLIQSMDRKDRSKQQHYYLQEWQQAHNNISNLAWQLPLTILAGILFGLAFLRV
jgi:hypothetical protein